MTSSKVSFQILDQRQVLEQRNLSFTENFLDAQLALSGLRIDEAERAGLRQGIGIRVQFLLAPVAADRDRHWTCRQLEDIAGNTAFHHGLLGAVEVPGAAHYIFQRFWRRRTGSERIERDATDCSGVECGARQGRPADSRAVGRVDNRVGGERHVGSDQVCIGYALVAVLPVLGGKLPVETLDIAFSAAQELSGPVVIPGIGQTRFQGIARHGQARHRQGRHARHEVWGDASEVGVIALDCDVSGGRAVLQVGAGRAVEELAEDVDPRRHIDVATQEHRFTLERPDDFLAYRHRETVAARLEAARGAAATDNRAVVVGTGYAARTELDALERGVVRCGTADAGDDEAARGGGYAYVIGDDVGGRAAGVRDDIRAVDAECAVARVDAFVIVVFDPGDEVGLVADVTAPSGGDGGVLVVAVDGFPVGGVQLPTSKLGVQDEIDHTRDGVGTVGR